MFLQLKKSLYIAWASRSISASESVENSHIAFQINSLDTELLSCENKKKEKKKKKKKKKKKNTAHHIMKTRPCNIYRESFLSETIEYFVGKK